MKSVTDIKATPPVSPAPPGFIKGEIMPKDIRDNILSVVDVALGLINGTIEKNDPIVTQFHRLLAEDLKKSPREVLKTWNQVARLLPDVIHKGMDGIGYIPEPGTNDPQVVNSVIKQGAEMLDKFVNPSTSVDVFGNDGND